MLFSNHFIGMRLGALPITYTSSSASDLGLGAAAIGAAATLGSGVMSSFTAGQANRRAQLMAREQMAFNKNEAKKNRKWQEDYYNRFSSPSALAAQYRAAGLNPQLANVQQGSVAQGSAASYSDVPNMQNEGAPLASAAASASEQMLAAYQNQTNRKAQQSQEQLNQSLETLQAAQKQLTDAETALTEQSTEAEKQRVEEMKQNVAFLIKTFDQRVNQVYSDTIIKNWLEVDTQYQAMQKMWSYYNINPLQQQQMIAQTINFYSSALKEYWQGRLTKKEFDNYERNFNLMQFRANTERINADAFSRDVDNKKDMYKASAREINARSAYQEMYNTMQDENVAAYQYNPKTHRYDIPYQDKRMRVGLDLNLAQNRHTLNLMLQQPDLIRSQTFRNYVEPVTGVVGNVAEGVTRGLKDKKGKSVPETTRRVERYDENGSYRGGSITWTGPTQYQ